MKEIPREIARAVVLRHVPRALRAGLDADAADGPLPAQLAADAEVASPGLGARVTAWLRENVGPCPGLDVSHEDGPAGPEAPDGCGLAALDRAAALGDDPVLREISDALVLLGAFDRVAPLAGRAAAAAWSYLDRLPEAGTRLHQLALATAGAQGGGHVARPPWPVLDAKFDLAAPADGAADRAGEAWRMTVDDAFADICHDARILAVGLSAVAAGRSRQLWATGTLAQVATLVGQAVARPLTESAEREGRRDGEERAQAEMADLRDMLRAYQDAADARREPGTVEVPPNHLVVCPSLPATGPGKGKDLARGYGHAIGTALPLVPTPDLAAVRRTLLDEFPHAVAAVDATLGAFAARPHVHAPPLLVAGPPGSGKSRFVRRLGESLGVGVYRVDGANDGGASFGGTERRWYSSEPCRPFMAVARYAQANPIVLVDEVDKAATRSEYGRLWDSMLQTLDPENAARFPDPSLQVELDLSWVTVVCTANAPSVLPGPLLDRMRVVRFPEAGPGHLDALLPGVLAGIAAEAGLDPRFHAPLDGVERAALRRRWCGGSLRRLRRAVEAILRVRDRALSGRPQ
ncbi:MULTISPECIES: AAA family ATPase [unclassified Methylobacterium]|uniref:AAA family ATPase n=1 Tax=unclassified Methylobacterium TaxID=2615210 RepID=UPI0008E90441|nr:MULTISPECIES: AAA family ATPase [unclassified Methylobacterium]SFU97668.1 ATPase family associated with various cellular activities (AAA) [Methylobacterium sp. UNCCL125]